MYEWHLSERFSVILWYTVIICVWFESVVFSLVSPVTTSSLHAQEHICRRFVLEESWAGRDEGKGLCGEQSRVVSALVLSNSSSYQALWATQRHSVNAAISTANKQQRLPKISCHVAAAESKNIILQRTKTRAEPLLLFLSLIKTHTASH